MSVDDHSPVVVLQYGDTWWRFVDPVGIVSTNRIADVPGALSEIEQAVERDNLTAAGYLSYEAAAGYGLAAHKPDDNGPPLLWFGLYDQRRETSPPEGTGHFSFSSWQPSIDSTAYLQGVERIKEAIAAGYTYQANFTFQLRADFAGDPWSFFAGLVSAQRAGYCAYIDLGRFAICSASPELFFRLDGERLESRPMKGTAPRGMTPAEDRRQMAWLHESEKNRAENVMIVDMIRNDFGRVAETGSVHVPRLFTIERYPTLLQMTSTVTAVTKAPLTDILAAVFPCASITGAPKVRTMSILRDLETTARGVYTGALGFIASGRQAQFNVAIRTAVIDRSTNRIIYGVGSGIIWDSDGEAEYDECLLKARVLQAAGEAPDDFQLLESMLWVPDRGYYLLDRHLSRLSDSAGYFGFDIDLTHVRRRLDRLANRMTAPVKVRLLINRSGVVSTETQPAVQDARPEPVRVGLARKAVATDNVWLYHKTTRRDIYEQARASRPDCDEVILWNERGELTEAGTANIIVELDGSCYTPPVSSGLLAGTLRAELLARGEVAERVLRLEELSQITRLWLINSVRGRREAILVDPPNSAVNESF